MNAPDATRTPILGVLRPPLTSARVTPVAGFGEGQPCTSVPSTAGRFAAWRPRPAREDVTRGVALLRSVTCTDSGEVRDEAGARVWNVCHKQRRRRSRVRFGDWLATARGVPDEGERVDGRIVNLATSNGHMYFHWLLDVLPRYVLARASGLADGVSVYTETLQPFQRESLEALGLEEHVIDASDIPSVHAREVVAPCHQLACGHLPPPWVVAFLREELYPRLSAPDSAHGSRIYVSRRDAARRRVVNESEIFAALEPLGFELVVPGEMSVADQMACFSKARVIVGPHGGGFANVMFTRPDALLVELFPNRYFDDGPYRLANAAGLRYAYVRERVASCSGRPIAVDFEIEPGDLLDTLAMAM